VGAALRESGQPRDAIVLCSKGGYIAFDGGRPHDARAYVEETLLRPGILQPDEIVAGCHSMAPRFLADQIARSRRNLGAECIDIYPGMVFVRDCGATTGYSTIVQVGRFPNADEHRGREGRVHQGARGEGRASRREPVDGTRLGVSSRT